MARSNRVVAGAAAAVAILALAACAGGTKPAEAGTASGTAGGGTITFRSWTPMEQTTQKIVAAFEEANPGATVKATIMNGVDYEVDIQTRATSGTFPDVVGLTPGAQTQMLREKLMPLDECAATTWGDDWQSKFHPIGLEQARLGNPEGDDSFYHLPFLVQTLNLWANTEIVDAYDVELPTTWDDLVTWTQELSGHEFAPFLIGAKDGWQRTSTFMQIANNIDPGIVAKAEAGEVPWTHESIVKAFEYWGKLFSDGIVQAGAMSLGAYPNAANQFEAGNAALIPLGAWWVQQSDPTKDQSQIPELSRGMAGYWPLLFPTIPGGASEPQRVGGIDAGLGISKDTANPELACKFVTDLIAGGGAQILVNTLNDLPAVTGVEPETFVSDKQQEVWDQLQSWMPDVKYSRYFALPDIDQAFQDATAAVATGQQTPEEAAAAVQRVADSLD